MATADTSTSEYIIALLVYVGLLALALYKFFDKFKKEGFRWGSFQTFFTFVICFLLGRIILVSFLMYIVYGFLPIREEQKGKPDFPYYEHVTAVLVILWEYFFSFGLCMLFTVVSFASHIWTRMVSGPKQNSFVGFVFFNALLYFVITIVMIIQFATSIDNIEWINAGLYYYCFNALGISVIIYLTVTKLDNIIHPEYVTSHTKYQMKKHLVTLKLCAVLGIIAYSFAAIARVIDAFGYRHITRGTRLQIVWNIFFKYICWIVPELFVTIFIGLAMMQTDNFASQLAYFAIQRQFGKEIPQEEVEDLEDLKDERNVEMTPVQYMKKEEEEEKDEFNGIQFSEGIKLH